MSILIFVISVYVHYMLIRNIETEVGISVVKTWLVKFQQIKTFLVKPKHLFTRLKHVKAPKMNFWEIKYWSCKICSWSNWFCRTPRRQIFSKKLTPESGWSTLWPACRLYNIVMANNTIFYGKQYNLYGKHFKIIANLQRATFIKPIVFNGWFINYNSLKKTFIPVLFSICSYVHNNAQHFKKKNWFHPISTVFNSKKLLHYFHTWQ